MLHPFINNSPIGLPQSTMWVLVALYHWQTAGHEAINLKMTLRTIIQAMNYQDSVRLVVSAGGVSSSIVGSCKISPNILQAVRLSPPLFEKYSCTPLQAFEELIDVKVLQSVVGSSSTNNQSKEFIKYKCMVDRAMLRQVVEKHGSTDVKSWLFKSGVMNS